jgi:hypothetical protein
MILVIPPLNAICVAIGFAFFGASCHMAYECYRLRYYRLVKLNVGAALFNLGCASLGIWYFAR